MQSMPYRHRARQPRFPNPGHCQNAPGLSQAQLGYYGPPAKRATGLANRKTAAGSSRRSFMGTFSIWHLLILGAIVLVLFGGRGKVSDLMGDFGKGINSFKKGLADNKEEPRSLNAEPAATKDKVSA